MDAEPEEVLPERGAESRGDDHLEHTPRHERLRRICLRRKERRLGSDPRGDVWRHDYLDTGRSEWVNVSFNAGGSPPDHCVALRIALDREEPCNQRAARPVQEPRRDAVVLR